MVAGNYSETYVASDFSAIIIDLLGTAAVALVGFASLVGLVILYKWFTGRKHVK